MITQKMLNELEKKYGWMSHIVIFSDFSGHIENGNDDWVENFNNLKELKILLAPENS